MVLGLFGGGKTESGRNPKEGKLSHDFTKPCHTLCQFYPITR